MEFDSEKLHTFRENQKTQFIASQFDTLAAQKVESEELAAADMEMAVGIKNRDIAPIIRDHFIASPGVDFLLK